MLIRCLVIGWESRKGWKLLCVFCSVYGFRNKILRFRGLGYTEIAKVMQIPLQRERSSETPFNSLVNIPTQTSKDPKNGTP